MGELHQLLTGSRSHLLRSSLTNQRTSTNGSVGQKPIWYLFEDRYLPSFCRLFRRPFFWVFTRSYFSHGLVTPKQLPMSQPGHKGAFSRSSLRLRWSLCHTSSAKCHKSRKVSFLQNFVVFCIFWSEDGAGAWVQVISLGSGKGSKLMKAF